MAGCHESLNSRTVPDRGRVHWFTKNGALCGAPQGAQWSFSAKAVTCRECLIAMRLEVLERRLELYRRSVALSRANPRKR